MTPLRVIPNVDEAELVPGYTAEHIKQAHHGMVDAIGGVPKGMQSGKTSVMLHIVLDNGESVFAETSLALLWTAALALKGKYPNES